jgi:STE24 endopeptidase
LSGPRSRAAGTAVLLLVALVSIAAIAWGAFAGSQPIGQRPPVRVTPVDAAWYAARPADPIAATRAFIDRVPAAARERAESYNRQSAAAIVLRLIVLLVVMALAMTTGLAARMRNQAQRVTGRVFLQDALVAAQFLALAMAAGLPVEVFAGFVRVRAAGLSHADFGSWLSDYGLQWGVDLVFYLIGIVAIMALIRRQPRAWPALATLVYVALYAMYTLVSPVFIEPLFNQFTQLRDGPARDRILSLARANGVATDGVYVKDASRQSVMFNASVSGVAGTARITLDDNTVESTPPAELEMVMAHEIGHYVLHHVLKATIFLGLVMGAGFVFVAWAMRKLFARGGARWGLTSVGDPGIIPLLWFLVALWGFVAMPVNNSIVRTHEAEADLYGLNASQQPIGLADFMLRDADAHPLSTGRFVEWALYTHPAPASRIATAMRWRAEHLPR